MKGEGAQKIDEWKRTFVEKDCEGELILDLRLSGQERSLVRGIQCAAFDVDRDDCSVSNVAVFCDFIVHGLEIGDCLVLVFQLASIGADLFRVPRVLPPFRLQFDDLPGPKVGENAVVTIEFPCRGPAAPRIPQTRTWSLGAPFLYSYAKDVESADIVTGVAFLVFVLG